MLLHILYLIGITAEAMTARSLPDVAVWTPSA